MESTLPAEHNEVVARPTSNIVKRRGRLRRFIMLMLKLALVGFVVVVLIAWRLWTLIAASGPQALPPLRLDAAQQAALTKRCEHYFALLDSRHNPGSLALDADELNFFIDSEPKLRNRLRVELSGNQLLAHVAMQYDPPRKKGDPIGDAFRGRWLNASGAFTISLANDDLSIHIERLVVDGWTIPSCITTRFLNQNLADALSNTDRRQFARKFENVNIHDGKLVFTPKVQPMAPARPAAAKR